jgi:hypothetical protein
MVTQLYKQGLLKMIFSKYLNNRSTSVNVDLKFLYAEVSNFSSTLDLFDFDGDAPASYSSG